MTVWDLRGVAVVALVIGSVGVVGCKKPQADTMAASSQKISSSPAVVQKFEWCKASAAAWNGLVDSVTAMERAGRTSVTLGGSEKANADDLPRPVLDQLNNPPTSEPKPCGESFDQALAQSHQQVASALSGQAKEVAYALGGGCEIQNSSGIMSITKLPSGNYRIELLGCGGHQRSEMIMSPKQLKGLAGTLLRGV